MATLNTKQPIFFERNRVYRIYTGGAPYPEFFGTDEEGDNYFPEEWVASSTKAINSVYFGERDGVSKIRGTNIFFDDALRDYKEDLLGDRKFDILIKFLDSAIRLPMQVHPTKKLAMKYFNSPHGKTESWYVLKTRPNAKIFFGFKDKVSYEKLLEMDDKSEYDKDAWEEVVMSVEPKVGDCFIVNAGLIHAIGYGCLLIEVQEPTDFTISPENWCGEYHLNEKEKYMGIKKEEAPYLFNLDFYGENAINKTVVKPKELINKNGYKKYSLITYNDTDCFRTNKHVLDNSSFTIDFGPSVYICIDGDGVVEGDNYSMNIKRGDYFFVPYSAQGKFNIRSDKHIELIECLPSKQ